MSRRVRALPPRALGAAAAQPVEIEIYLEKVLKYIAADIGAGWGAVTGPVCTASDTPRPTGRWVAFAAGAQLPPALIWT